MNQLIDPAIQELQFDFKNIISKLNELCADIDHQHLTDMMVQMQKHAFEPFMFVIVGEVKAGKSSFINALLSSEKEICKVAPDPCTDTIQQVTWGEEEKEVVINPYLKKIFQPSPILKDIAIVDTPGTNTIIEHHQEITERFIPVSDLIVFVFEAKNPYRQSAWNFFNLIHQEWHKKILFILQQKDLLNQSDLYTNLQGVVKQAKQKGIEHPVVFAVSAKMELEGNTTDSGFAQVKEHIQENITGGQAPYLKLENNATSAQNINDRINNALSLRKDQYKNDLEFRNEIRTSLDDEERKSQNQVGVMVENLIAGYDRITLKHEKSLAQGLSFTALLKRSLQSIFKKRKTAKQWLTELKDDLESDLNQELKSKLSDGIVDVADRIQSMAKIVELKIQQKAEGITSELDLFEDIIDKRNHVLQDLREAFTRFINQPDQFTDTELFDSDTAFSPSVATGSGVAVVGIILSTVTNGMVFDITGGVLTAIGLLFAGVTAGINKRKIIKGYRNEIDKGKNVLTQELDLKLKAYIGHIKERIDGHFSPLDQHLSTEKSAIDGLEEKYIQISHRLDDFKLKIKESGNHG
jgi:GTPase SAR1 family protein